MLPLLVAAVLGLMWVPSLALAASDEDAWSTTAQPFLKNYCWECHGEQKQKGDLNIQAFSTLSGLSSQGDAVSGMRRRLANNEMPPSKARQPSAQERAAMVQWLAALEERGHPRLAGDPGLVVIPHVTPTQYERIVHDLTGMNLPLAAQLPRDGGAGEGFDNVGAAQAMTTMHIQAYYTSAVQISSHARILPGMPIEWNQEAGSFEARSSEELYAILANEFQRYVQDVWAWQYNQHMAAIKPLFPSDQQWQNYTGGDLMGAEWLIVYLHAAWQYRHRAELGHPDWTPADTAAAYQVPLNKIVLTRLVAVLGAKSWNLYWNQLVNLWEKLPPPPVADAVMRDDCAKLLGWSIRHIYIRNHDTTAPPETSVLLPIEIDQSEYLKVLAEPYYTMMLKGRHPFRFKLSGQRDLYLVTTDAEDGSDDDVMIWEHGVITVDGHEQPWTGLTIRDRTEAPVPWGSHPIGHAAVLPDDSIAVHAPAVLHVTFPPGTTHFRIDARADPVYAKNGSMQVVPYLRPPSEDELHFARVRYVFGAPGSKRQRAIMDASELTQMLGPWPMADAWNLLPRQLKNLWGNLHDKSISADWGENYAVLRSPPTPESVFGAGFPRGWPGEDRFWRGSSTFLLAGATDGQRKQVSHIIDKMLATLDARDTLAFFLADQKIPLENAAAALTVTPVFTNPAFAQHYHNLLDAAHADEQRLLDCAQAQITDFANRAWRRPPSARCVAELLKLYRLGRDDGLCYEACMKRAMVGVLTSPYFLYRVEPAQQHDVPYALAGRELADRLAAVVWGSIPDAELTQAGASGQLADAAGLRHQIQRMIADRRSQALAAEFAGQIYLFEGFDSFAGPDSKRFPEFTPGVRAAMYQECLEFFGNLFKEDCPLTDVIDADYTFLNQDLAGFYGIQGVAGPAFRKVKVNPAERGGILGMGAILVSTSLPLRTSPIKRGNWVLTHLLGTPPPPPPAAVPQLSNEESDEQKLTIVQQMKRHRSDPQCMSCHERIDPLGITLETFDPIGRRRAKLEDGSQVIDQETDVDGNVLKGFAALKRYLSSDPARQTIVRNMCGKFLGYALGRGLIPSDQALIDHLMADLAAHQWRSSALILGVLTSPEFTQRRDDLDAVISKPEIPKSN